MAMFKDHIRQVPYPNGTEEVLLHYEIRKRTEQSHGPLTLIVHKTRLKLSLYADVTIPQCTTLKRTIQRIVTWGDSDQRTKKMCVYFGHF